jgi:hypothetical protein
LSVSRHELIEENSQVSGSILYCGDTSLGGPAAYLAGLLTVCDCDFDYFRSDQSLSTPDVQGRSLIILSDFPSARMGAEVQSALLDAVSAGSGLLMIGGWESFHGVGGDWDAAAVADVLPVVIEKTDDRMNCDHPVVVRQVSHHAAVDGLPWEMRPPVVGGFNRFQPKPTATVVLEADRLRSRYVEDQWCVELIESHPLLVMNNDDAIRTAALATDAAPHWVGGFVDWGDGRVCAKASGADAVEFGDLYARFWQQLISYLSRQPIS